MPVVICLVAAVILGGVVVVAMGRGGELFRERPDLPVRTDFQSWSDVAEYRPPAALLGYHAAATEHALALIARTIAERDAEIDWLRRRLAEFQPESAPDLDADTGAAEPADSAPAADPVDSVDPAGSLDPVGSAGAADSTNGVGAADRADAGRLPSELSWPVEASGQAEPPVANGLSAHSAHQALGARASEDE